MSDEFLLTVLLTFISAPLYIWSTFKAQDKCKEAKYSFIIGGGLVVLYLVALGFYSGSVGAFLYRVWSLLLTNVRWWQVILLALMVVILNFLSRRGLKSKIGEGVGRGEGESISTRKGKKLSVFKWMGDKEDMVGKGELIPDGEKDGSFLLIPRRAGRIVSLDLKEIGEDGSETRNRWNTLPGSCWPLGVVDQRTGKMLNSGKEIRKLVRKETKLMIYAAKTPRGFKGRYKIEIGFSSGKKKKLFADV